MFQSETRLGWWVRVFFVGCGVFLIVAAGYELVQADYAQAARRFGVGIVGILFGFLARDL